MKPKKIKEIDPFVGLFSTFNQMANLATGGEVPGRDDVFRYEEGYIVDTCVAFDTGTWETGIRPENESWIIVEQYNDRNEAEIGHAKWVELMKENPKRKIEDINLWGI